MFADILVRPKVQLAFKGLMAKAWFAPFLSIPSSSHWAGPPRTTNPEAWPTNLYSYFVHYEQIVRSY